MAPNDPKALTPGSITEIVARVCLWAERALRGFARVEFDSEHARRYAVTKLRDALATKSIALHEIDLPMGQSPEEVVRFLVEKLEAIKDGVVSISGFDMAFANDAHSMRILNFGRENLARFPLCQIWWMSPRFTDQMLVAAADLNSWFVLRLKLTEQVRPTLNEGGIAITKTDKVSVNTDEARKSASRLVKRFERSLLSDTTTDEQLCQLAEAAIEALLKAGLHREGRELEMTLAQQIVSADQDHGTIAAEPKSPTNAPSDWNVPFWIHRRSLAIMEKALGPDHPNVASRLNNLARLYHEQAQYAQAEPLYKRALAIREKALGPDHPDVAESLNNLAILYDTQGHDVQAEPLYKRSLAIREKALGPDHPDVATSLNNLAVLYYTQGQYAQAELLYKHSLAIREKALGPDHPDVAASLNNLAGLYYTQGQYAQADPLHKRSMEIGEKALGPDHPEVARGLENMAALYRKTGREKDAEVFEKRAAAIRAMAR